MDDTLNTVLRTPKTPTIGGKTYTLKPFGVLAVPIMSRLVSDIWIELVQRPDLLQNRDALLGWVMSHLPQMVETKIEDLLALLAMQTGETRDALVALPLDEFIELGNAGLEDGLDFFTHRVAPMLKKKLAGRGIGAMFSPPSSQPDTAATTSSSTA